MRRTRIAGMARASAPSTAVSKPAIGLTMFGVTTPCVTQVVELLERDYDCLVFHATGTGGRAMEKLVDSGLLVGVIDVTTTEICDLLFGGVLSAGPDRLGAIARTAIPYVGSVGALDMVNFGAFDTVPGAVSRPQSLPAQSAGDADAHHAPRRTGRWARGSRERLNRCEGAGALPDPGRRRLGASTRRASRSTIRRRTRRCSRRWRQTLGQTDHAPADPAAASHQRSGILRRAGGEFRAISA